MRLWQYMTADTIPDFGCCICSQRVILSTLSPRKHKMSDIHTSSIEGTDAAVHHARVIWEAGRLPALTGFFPVLYAGTPAPLVFFPILPLTRSHRRRRPLHSMYRSLIDRSLNTVNRLSTIETVKVSSVFGEILFREAA